MALQELPNITCSLSVGANAYIYNFSYSYEPQQGVRLTVFFVNPLGKYNTSNLLSATTPSIITMGSSFFKAYPISFKENKTSGQRTLQVSFVDDTFKLNNYYVTLKGQGCGPNIFELGKPIDNGTVVLDETQQKIQDLTRFPDLEYGFDDFLVVLRSVFPISSDAYYDSSVTKNFVGSFLEVLNSWCSYFNMVYFFENGILRITSPSSLALTFPAVPVDAISENREESLDGTFTKTVSSYFRQEGGQFTIPNNNANTDSNSSLITYVTAYPVGAEYNLPQTEVDLNQVAAAMYGQRYWFLHNYAQGTAKTECGWVPTNIYNESLKGKSIRESVEVILNGKSGGVASFDTDFFNERFAFYKEYGERIAGRYYLSYPRNNIEQDQSYSWYDQSTTENFLLSALTDPVSVQYYLNGITSSNGTIPNTEINKFYGGINANGNRIYYYDSRKIDFSTIFALTDAQKNLAEQLFLSLTQGSFGSSSLDFSEISPSVEYVVYADQIIQFFADDNTGTFLPPITDEQINSLKPAYESILLKGVKQSSLVTQNDGGVDIITNEGPVVVSNSSTIKTQEGSSQIVYYSKFEKCVSESSPETNSGNVLRHTFVPRQISADIPVSFSAANASSSTYSLKRDLTYVNKYSSSELLRVLAMAQTIPFRSLSFSMNYLSPLLNLTNCVSQGLSSFDIEIGDSGMIATYTFSNAVLRVPTSEAFIEKLENNMKPSWTRQYHPQKTIGN